jgi:hypothetical protein
MEDYARRNLNASGWLHDLNSLTCDIHLGADISFLLLGFLSHYNLLSAPIFAFNTRSPDKSHSRVFASSLFTRLDGSQAIFPQRQKELKLLSLRSYLAAIIKICLRSFFYCEEMSLNLNLLLRERPWGLWGRGRRLREQFEY